MIFRVSEIGHKKKEEKKGLFLLCVPPPFSFVLSSLSWEGSSNTSWTKG